MIIIPQKGTKTGYYVKCEYCGKEVYQTKTQYNRAKHHFCSNECATKYRRNQAYEERECEICGNLFATKKIIPQRFCSIECQHEWQKKNVGTNNCKYNRIECVCETCGKEIHIIPSNYKRFKHHFCSEECSRKWYSDVFSQLEEHKAESRDRALKMLNSRVIDTNTKPQIITNGLLDNLNINYCNEYLVDYYSIDNYLPDYNLMIEVMGDYWHCNPCKYTENNIYEMQRKIIIRDKAKHTYIYKYYNIQILYLWENDIYNNIELCKKIIQHYINHNGDIENYHSFNYEYSEDNLILKNNLIIPYQDK